VVSVGLRRLGPGTILSDGWPLENMSLGIQANLLWPSLHHLHHWSLLDVDIRNS